MNMRKLTGKAAILAAAFALGAATTAEAARNWTGNIDSNWATSGNWSDTIDAAIKGIDFMA
jgi:hypothetical protein